MVSDGTFTTNNKKNKAKRYIEQSQSSNQNGQCLAGGTKFLSCNNLSLQGQFNIGNNALAHDSGNGNGKGGESNSAEQSISQSQSSNQKS